MYIALNVIQTTGPIDCPPRCEIGPSSPKWHCGRPKLWARLAVVVDRCASTQHDLSVHCVCVCAHDDFCVRVFKRVYVKINK